MASTLSKKALDEKIRQAFMEKVNEMFLENGEEVLAVASNKIAIPTLNENGDDEWIEITFKVPTGSRDGDLYDGYALAEEYKAKLADKAEKAVKAKLAKAEKIAKAKAEKEAKAKAKAEHQAKGE